MPDPTGTPVPGGTKPPGAGSIIDKLKKNKIVLFAGVGALAGVVVLLAKSGKASTEDATGAGLQTNDSGIAAYDSTSADVAAQLGQYQTGLQTALGEYGQVQKDQLADYGEQLTESLAGLTKGQPTASTGLLPAGAGWFATGSKQYTAQSIANRYKISVESLKTLNPGLKITSGSTKIGKNLPVKVRSNAAPWNLEAYRRFNKK